MVTYLDLDDLCLLKDLEIGPVNSLSQLPAALVAV